MGSGSNTQPTQSTTFTPSAQQKQIMDLAMPGLTGWAGSVPQRYAGETVAGFTAPQTAGQNMALDAAGTQAGIASGAADTLPFFFNNLTDVNSNPALRGAIDASVRPITENLTQTQLPAIRGEFGMGNFGSSRQGIAEGLASGQASQAIGDTANKLVNATYDTNLRSMLQALGLVPTVQQAQTAPAATTSAVGDVQQAREQALINADIGNFNYDEWAPFLQAKELFGVAGGIPGGTTTSTANNPPPAPGWQQSLGGAATGAALGSLLLPGIGTGIGAAGGALLPFLFQ